MGINFLKEKGLAGLALGILAIIFSWIEFYMIYPIINSINSLKFSNPFEGFLLMIKFVFRFMANNMDIKFVHVCIFILGLLVISLLISVLASMVLVSANDFLDGKRGHRIKVSKRKFIRIWSMVIIASLLIILGIFMFLIVIIPALLITSMYINGKISLVKCVFFDIVTILVIFSTLVYIRIPIWNELKNIVSRRDEKISDDKFKKLVTCLVLFDVIFILSRIVMILLRLNFNGVFSMICQFIVLIFINLIYGVYRVYDIFNVLKY